MTETIGKTDSGEQSLESESIPDFSRNVEINGLPFVFNGRVDRTAKEVIFQLCIPTWEEEARLIEISSEELSKREIMNPHDLRLSKGLIGWLTARPTGTNIADICVSEIRSVTPRLARESRYVGAEGIGNFLFDNFLLCADTNGWRATLSIAGSGPLSNEDLRDWYQRKGFSTIGDKGDYIRTPREPDTTQVIGEFLEK
jgi:hypothetical protein